LNLFRFVSCFTSSHEYWNFDPFLIENATRFSSCSYAGISKAAGLLEGQDSDSEGGEALSYLPEV
jgi:hypothetical protein